MPKFTKKIMPPGTYRVNGQEVFVSPERLQKWADNHNRMVSAGLRIPAPWRHDSQSVPFRAKADDTDIDASNNAGWWEKVWIENGTLYGTVDIPRDEDASRVGTTVTEVSPLITSNFSDNETTYDEAMTHIALVTHPVVKGQENFKPIAASVAFSAEDFLSKTPTPTAKPDLPFSLPEKTAGAETLPGGKVMATGASIAKALPILAKIGLKLPDDTNEANFAERVIVASLALSAASGESDDSEEDPPTGSEEKPSPIAMSEETKLTEGQQGQLAFAKQIIIRQYGERIKACLEKGQITPQQVEQIKPLCADVTLEFSSEGQIKPNALDVILKTWEAIPAGTILTGRTSTGLQKAKAAKTDSNAFQFSLGDVNFDYQDQPLPEGSHELSLEEIDAIIDGQFKAAGRA